MKTLTDAERIDLLEQLLSGVPDAVISYNGDCEEDEYGMLHEGWNIRLPEGCYTPTALINSDTFRGVVDALAEWKKDEEPSAGFRP